MSWWSDPFGASPAPATPLSTPPGSDLVDGYSPDYDYGDFDDDFADFDDDFLGTDTPSFDARHRSRGRGRCGATPRINGRRTQARNLTHTTTGPDGTTRTLKLTKSQMRALEAEFALAGLTWDHQITSTAPGGAQITHYADSSTIRGGLPLDFPLEMRAEFAQHCQEVQRFASLDGDARSEYRAALALALREGGYPAPDSNAFERIRARLNPLGSYREYRTASPLDIANLRECLQHVDGAGFHAYLALGGSVQVTLDANGSITSALAGGQSVLGYAPSGPAARSYDLLGENLRCYKCTKPRGLCDCGTGVTERDTLEHRLRDPWYGADLNSAADPDFYDSPDEHRWGRNWAVRPSLTDHATAAASRTEVEALLEAALGPDEWERVRAELGSEVAYDVAMLCVQTSSPPAELLTPATSQAIVSALRQADVVVQRFHPRHGHVLYDTFDRTPAPRDAEGRASRTELYLGRDGVYMWAARMESQTVLRRHGLGTESSIRYITMSTGAEWYPADHDHLLGDGPWMAVDTGFSGSIVKRILRRRAQAGTGDADGELYHHTKLLSSDSLNLVTPPLRAERGMSSVAGYVIEHGPKPHKTTTDVGGISQPTGAVEQMLFRQTMRTIRREARRDAEEIVAGTRPEKLLGPLDRGGYASTPTHTPTPAPWEEDIPASIQPSAPAPAHAEEPAPYVPATIENLEKLSSEPLSQTETLSGNEPVPASTWDLDDLMIPPPPPNWYAASTASPAVPEQPTSVSAQDPSASATAAASSSGTEGSSTWAKVKGWFKGEEAGGDRPAVPATKVRTSWYVGL